MSLAEENRFRHHIWVWASDLLVAKPRDWQKIEAKRNPLDTKAKVPSALYVKNLVIGDAHQYR